MTDRQEQRFPSVGMTLSYSLAGSSDSGDLAQTLFEASLADLSLSGMAFDVDRPLEPDARILVVLEAPESGVEQLESRVVWCSRIGGRHYRVGVRIDHSKGIVPGEFNEERHVNIQKGSSIPVTTRFYCPACGALSYFDFVGMERMPESNGALPLYDCSACASTRSIMSILQYNRAKLVDR